jgi:hypothetical protein
MTLGNVYNRRYLIVSGSLTRDAKYIAIVSENNAPAKKRSETA